MINKRYKILKKLGEGRSQVFSCEDDFYPGQLFAVKIISGKISQDELNSFENEYTLLDKLKHPHIISVFNYGTILELDANEDERFSINQYDRFIILEYYDGVDLFTFYHHQNEKVLTELIKQICDALYYLHQSNYIYYDLKPENILVKIINNTPFIKFIDFGFAKYVPVIDDSYSVGTKEYIAPEILRKEPVDHRIDLYSLGIVQYKLIYEQFPFQSDNELEIFKAHLESDFEYPSSPLGKKYEPSLKKLLMKNPTDRFYTSLQLLYSLSIPYDETIVKHWNLISQFSNRKDVLNAVKNYLSFGSEGRILTLQGEEKSGRSQILKEISKFNEDVVLIEPGKGFGNKSFWEFLIYRFIYFNTVFSKIDESLLRYIDIHLSETSENLVTELKSIVSKISQFNKFILLLDDIHTLDSFSIELLQQLFPILQANGIHIITCESKEKSISSQLFNNVEVINLTPFTPDDVKEYIDISYSSFFPKKKLNELLLKYCDRMPGNIEEFISNLIRIEIIDFTSEGPTIRYEEEHDVLLESLFDHIYKLKINQLGDKELEVARIVSAFEVPLDEKSISKLVNIDEKLIEIIVDSLRTKDIFQTRSNSITPAFVSTSLKNYLYRTIKNIDKYHLIIGEKLAGLNLKVGNVEIARHFELGKDNDSSYTFLMKEIDSSKKLSTYSYSKQLLLKINSLQLDPNKKFTAAKELCSVFLRLGDLNNGLNLVNSLLDQTKEPQTKVDLLILKGKFLVGLGELEESKNILLGQLNNVLDGSIKNDLLLEIAGIELDLNNYEQVENICNTLIKNENTNLELKGKTENLMGLVQIYNNNDPIKALPHFNNALDYYEKLSDPLLIAGMELNLGNIYNMIADQQSAQAHWNKALQINQSIGNIEQEAKILLNYGIYYYDNKQYEKAIENYRRAHNIFIGVGNTHGRGLVLSNIGEASIVICEYQEAYNALVGANKIFNELNNKDELAEIYFLQGCLYSKVGNKNLLLESIKALRNADEAYTERFATKLKYLELLHNLLIDQGFRGEKELIELAKDFQEKNDIFHSGEAVVTAVQRLITLKDFDKAYNYLTSSEIISLIEKQSIFKACMEMFLGKISDNRHDEKLEPPINYYLRSFEILENESITDYTWQSLYLIADYFTKRGNYVKARDYAVYAQSLLKMIIEKIELPFLKEYFKKRFDVSFTLQKLKLLEKHF